MDFGRRISKILLTNYKFTKIKYKKEKIIIWKQF